MSDNYLDTILFNMPAGVAVLEGPEFRYSKINLSLANINGLSVADHIGRPLEEVIPKAAKNIIPRLRKVWKSNKTSPQFEFSTILPKNPNQTKWFMDSFFPINGKDGKIKAVGGVVLDITRRKETESALKESHDLLEQRVLDRTNELRKSEQDLKDKNIVLKELLIQIESEKKQTKDDIMSNVENLIMPSIEKLRLKGGSKKHIDQLRRNIENLTSSFSRKIADHRKKLSPREMEVCNLVKNDLSNKEMANLLNIAVYTIEAHRRMIRRKLDLANKDINLNTYLNSL